MPKKDKRVDAYVAAAQPFAKPVLKHLRAVVHKGCPQVEETIKWTMPHFMYEGKILCSMASFTEHCAFGFRLAAAMKDPGGLMTSSKAGNGMGHLGKIRSLKDLPTEKTLIAYIREAMELTDKGVKKPRSKAI